jgi:signal peptidase II
VLIASLLGILLLAGADQLIKYWAVTQLQPVGEKPFLHFGDFQILGFRYLENDGAVFSSFSGMRWLLIVFTSLMMVVCLIYLIREYRKSKLLTASLTLIIGGGIGNLIDRIFRDGLVVDYLDVKLFHFAVFNFADCCVVVGVVLLAWYLLFGERRQKPAEKQESKNA